MKKTKLVISIILVLTVGFSCLLTAHAVQLYSDGDYTYADIDQNNVALFGYSGDSNVLIVPQSFSERRVSEIYEYAFDSRTSFTSIDFSQNRYLTAIGTKAFNECTGLSGTLTTPASLRTLGFAAFQGCSGIETVNLNLGLKEVSEQCFNRCSGLKTVSLPTGLESIDRLAFGNCSSLECVYLPKSVTFISDYAFTNSDPTMYVYTDSYAHQFAVEKGYDIVLLDASDPTVPTEPSTEPETVPETEPQNELVTTSPVEITYVLGDADGDGDVNILDATKIQRVLVELDPDDDGMIALRGNVNNAPDGLNILHATKIQRWIAGFETEEPIGEEFTATI